METEGNLDVYGADETAQHAELAGEDCIICGESADALDPQGWPLCSHCQESARSQNASYCASVERAQLTAQFRAPVTREEQRKRLRPSQARPQCHLFRASAEPAQYGFEFDAA